MKWQILEQPYANISTSFPGENPETGRNRAELVLQFRDPAIDSDLAWSDASVLASSLVPAPATPAGGTLQPLRPATVFEPVARRDTTGVATVQDRLGQRIDLERVIELGGVVSSALGGVTPPAARGSGKAPIVTPSRPGDITTTIPGVIDPVVWQVSATLPSLTGKVARLALREYERFYTDRTVPEKVGSATWRRRVIEERLVFTTLFDL